MDDISKPRITISVRNIIEFILRRGNIDSAALSPKSDLNEGTKTHRQIQRTEKTKGNYFPEVRLSHTEDMGDFLLTVQGIADGIIVTDEGVTVDEIKSTAVALEAIDENFNFLHKAQACFYAYFYCIENGLESITVRLSYSHIKTREIKYFLYHMTLGELKNLFDDTTRKYAVWARFTYRTEESARQSAKALAFPFPEYRKGQRELAASVYRAIRDGRTLFAQAPTGLGKTMSVLFASVKAYGEQLSGKIFYLTAKNLTRTVARDAMTKMAQKGLRVKAVIITSKEKICPYNKECTPSKCPYAEGHYDRINDALLDVLTHVDLIDTDTVMAFASKHRVCPFELSLDISLFCQVVICDCNYAFDPRARLRRFFDTDKKTDMVLLCDEAHNLVERGREMFSAEISKKAVLETSKILKKCAPKCAKILKKTNNILVGERHRLSEAAAGNSDPEDVILCTGDQQKSAEEIYKHAYQFTEAFSAFLSEEGYETEKSAAAQLFFDLSAYISVYEQTDENYRIFTSDDGDLKLKLFCVNPAPFLGRICGLCRCSVFFSATLLPQQYYLQMLSPDPENCICVRFSSPFPRENLFAAIYPAVSTRRRDRNVSVAKLSELIADVTKRTGNYLIFFPSFSYMEQVYRDFTGTYDTNAEIIIQQASMDESGREAFIAKFAPDPKRSLIAFAVTGGVFSEGIDLVGERLSGTLIVSVGLPKICGQRDLIRDFYDNSEGEGCGYMFAYAYPGFNRVMQAAGRVIRTETDKGFVILADDRFTTGSYRNMFPPEWSDRKIFRSSEILGKKISEFFNKNE